MDIDSIYNAIAKHYPGLVPVDHATLGSEDWADAISDLDASIEALKGLSGEAEKDQLIRLRSNCLNVLQVMRDIVDFVDEACQKDAN